MKTDKKTRTNKKAFDTHPARITSTDGQASVKNGKRSYTIEDSFPSEVSLEFYKRPLHGCSVETTKKYQEQWLKPEILEGLYPDGETIRTGH